MSIVLATYRHEPYHEGYQGTVLWQVISRQDPRFLPYPLLIRLALVGNMATAAFIGNQGAPRIRSIPMPSEKESVYTAHLGDRLKRIMIINFEGYNTTAQNYTSAYARPSFEYDLDLPRSCRGPAQLQRLSANGSDAISGITWDGFSYAHDLDQGRPVRLENVTRGEHVAIRDHAISVTLPASSAVIVHVDC